jgi:hypothetical protein
VQNQAAAIPLQKYNSNEGGTRRILQPAPTPLQKFNNNSNNEGGTLRVQLHHNQTIPMQNYDSNAGLIHHLLLVQNWAAVPLTKNNWNIVVMPKMLS